ncbi:hypothetical protein CF386_04490 [Paraphotobacterium marinum]|uniref:DNA polymerase III subunit chi n=1 Tax=Paraphotobacterium marinum TaxID=1755811 RepID=A0A220VD96_9GAMM|nr:DNA polymerase III subunit chi [Paraphotobacterium marinum]ASK78325.1 hypothetical protein CF386_04490 [Paraphotobacterium marinum]
MKKAIFFQIENDEVLEQRNLNFLVGIIEPFYNIKKQIFILVNNELSEQKLDEFLWNLPAEKFLAHCISSEVSFNGSPIVISHNFSNYSSNRIFINLSESLVINNISSATIIDFVPNKEELKKSARMRYMQYKKLGFNIKTHSINSVYELDILN